MSGDETVLVRAQSIGACYRQSFWRNTPEDYWALKDVSFELVQGETLGIVGRNGAGKTTLLQIIAGISEPDRGEIDRGDARATLLSLNAGMQDNLTGRENAVISGMLLGLSRREISDHLDDIAEFSELGAFFDRPVASYSAGMRARLGFSTAIQLDPEVLLIDEILGVGDAPFRAKCMEVLSQRLRSDRTVVLVAHGMDVIRTLCDRALWIEDGVARAIGPASDVVGAYQRALAPP